MRSFGSGYSISIVAFQFVPSGTSGVVGVDLVLDAGLLEHLLDAQHLLDLVADRQLVLELHAEVLAEVHGAQLPVRDDAARLALRTFA